MTNVDNDWQKFKDVLMSDPMKAILKDDKYAMMTLRQVSNELNKTAFDSSFVIHNVPKELDNFMSCDITKFTKDDCLSDKKIQNFDLYKFVKGVQNPPQDLYVSYVFTWVDDLAQSALEMGVSDLFKLDITIERGEEPKIDFKLLSQDGENNETDVDIDEFKKLEDNQTGNTSKFIQYILQYLPKKLSGGSKLYKKTEKKIHCAGRERVVYVCERKQYVKIKGRFVSLKEARELLKKKK